ncbi:MAG: prepilin-type N-terminal cleavage/methylation domain-containing protein [Candidatus Paceibacterota bacterium]
MAKKYSLKLEKGFTLIELLVVISIIGVLSTIAMTSLNGARAKARDARRRTEIGEIKKALEIYYSVNG